ncbi:MAG TPA: IS21 family transposase [Saprospiraceae bacterium]|nr:IS21 family transposase [Saprospiraceae bacterium]
MAGQRIDMMELRTLILLKQKNLSNRKIALTLGVDRKTIDSYVSRFKALDLDYNELSTLDEKDLQELFIQDSQIEKARYELLSSYFEYIKKELTKPGATLQYLHYEYLQTHSDGYKYTQFAFHFRKWLGKISPGGKLTHKAGEKLYVDFCGKKLHYIDKASGEEVAVEVFVAILPCSQYTFVRACYSQKREDMISCLRECLSFLGGVPQAIVSDNLKAAVTRAHKYAPIINKTLKDFALHYSCAIEPTRPYEPKDKALVEGAVKLVYQRIYYPLSKQIFFSLKELNTAISEQLVCYNDFLFSHGGSTRHLEFLDIEKHLLSDLPAYPYHIREYRKAKVQGSSHVFLSEDRNYYSVPCRYSGLYVQIQYNRDMVEIFHNYDRIATHKRCHKPGIYTTINEHMPQGTQFYSRWNPAFFEDQAKRIGPGTEAYIHRMLTQYSYPEHGYKQSQGILAMAKLYSAQRLEKACLIAWNYSKSSYHTIEQILKKGLEDCVDTSEAEIPFPDHDNIRGATHYQ